VISPGGRLFETAGVTKHLAVATSVLILVGMLIAYFVLDPSALADGTFVSLSNTALPLVLAATAETVVLIGGGIDLSVGVVISLVSVIVATTMQGSVHSMLLWSLVAIVVGCLVGLVNAVLIEYLRISAFIATLATLEVVQGLALGVLGSPGGTVPADFSSAVTGTSFRYIPNAMLIIAGIILLYVIGRHVRAFRWIYAVGSDRQAARTNGIRDRRVVMGSYIACGGIAAVGGLCFAALLSSGDPIEGANYLLPGIAAAVIGGTSVFGGKGGVPGSVVGAFILTVLSSVLFAAHVTPFYEAFFTGLATVLIVGIGVTIDRWTTSRLAAQWS
jgi:ribose transport system permease protein